MRLSPELDEIPETPHDLIGRHFAAIARHPEIVWDRLFPRFDSTGYIIGIVDPSDVAAFDLVPVSYAGSHRIRRNDDGTQHGFASRTHVEQASRYLGTEVRR